MSRLFISYSSSNRDIALQIADDLEAAGHIVWIDRKGIRGGMKWAAEIARAISECDFFVLLMTSQSLISDNVRKEVDLAAGDNKTFLPIVLETCEIPFDFKYHLAGIQHIDFIMSYADGIRTLQSVLPSAKTNSESETQSAQALNESGLNAMKQGFYSVAIEYFDRAIKLVPDYADAYHNRGKAYLEIGEEQLAKKDFYKARELSNS